MSYDEAAAARYEDDPEHMLASEEIEVWLMEMASHAKDRRHWGRLLDVGAGTGRLTMAAKAAGYTVTGLEPSRPMVEEALARNPHLRREEFIVSASGNAALFCDGTFDWIVSRQVLCHLEEPERVFAAWFRWLRPGGLIMLVDGFWRRSGWAETDLARHPFAAVQSAQPVSDALSSVGFAILRAGPFGELNAARAGRWPETTARYVVVARKDGSR